MDNVKSLWLLDFLELSVTFKCWTKIDREKGQPVRRTPRLLSRENRASWSFPAP